MLFFKPDQLKQSFSILSYFSAFVIYVFLLIWFPYIIYC